MKFVLKNRIAFIVLCLLVTPPVFSSDKIQKNFFNVDKFLALSSFLKNPSFSGVTSFFAEHAVGGIGLLSCLGLGITTVTVLSPTVAVGLGCSLGYFSLFGNLALKELLFRTKKIDNDLQTHYKKTDENQKQTNKNFIVVNKNLENLQLTVEQNRKENAISFKGVNTQLSNLESTVTSNHQESTNQLNILQNTQKQTNQEVVSVQSSLSYLTETVQKHNAVNVEENKKLKENLEFVRDRVEQTYSDLKIVSVKADCLENNTQKMQQTIKENEIKAEQRHQETKDNHTKTQLELAIIKEGQQHHNKAMQNVVVEVGDLRFTVQENKKEITSSLFALQEKQNLNEQSAQDRHEKISKLTTELLDKQESLKNELKANEKQVEELTKVTGRISVNIDYLVEEAKQKKKLVPNNSISSPQQQQKITEDDLKAFFTKLFLEMSLQKLQKPTYGQEESGNNAVIEDLD